MTKEELRKLGEQIAAGMIGNIVYNDAHRDEVDEAAFRRSMRFTAPALGKTAKEDRGVEPPEVPPSPFKGH